MKVIVTELRCMLQETSCLYLSKMNVYASLFKTAIIHLALLYMLPLSLAVVLSDKCMLLIIVFKGTDICLWLPMQALPSGVSMWPVSQLSHRLMHDRQLLTPHSVTAAKRKHASIQLHQMTTTVIMYHAAERIALA